jgi:hypothetical protein
MKHIQLSLHLTEEEKLGIKSVTINFNDTGLPSDSKLIELIALGLLKSIHMNKDSLELQDLLRECGIVKSKK